MINARICTVRQLALQSNRIGLKINSSSMHS